MALLNSEKVALGTPMPHFELPSVDGDIYNPESFADKRALVVMFICNHCPYVVAVEGRIIQLSRDYSGLGAQVIGICSNDPTDYPDDSPENLLQRWRDKEYAFPYLIDETQEVAKAFGAVCTPDIFVYDRERKLAYHGRIDDNWKEPSKVTQRELRDALEKLIRGERPAAEQHPSMGCSIKWKKS